VPVGYLRIEQYRLVGERLPVTVEYDGMAIQTTPIPFALTLQACWKTHPAMVCSHVLEGRRYSY